MDSVTEDDEECRDVKHMHCMWSHTSKMVLLVPHLQKLMSFSLFYTVSPSPVALRTRVAPA